MTELTWAKQKTDELVFLALLAKVPPDEREACLTGMRITIWEVEQEKKDRKLTKHPQK